MRISVKVALASLAGICMGIGLSLVAPVALSNYRKVFHNSLTPQQWHDRYLAEFRSEVIDVSWSIGATQAVRDWLQTISAEPHGFEAMNVACRSRSCVVDLEWKSLRDAQSDVGKLIAFAPSSGEINCASQLFLPPTEVSPYRANLILVGCRH